MLATIDQPTVTGPQHFRATRPVVLAAGAAFAVLAVALVVALVWISRLADDLDATQAAFAEVQADLVASESALEGTRSDLARVEAGSALFASQVQGFADQFTELQPTIADGIDGAIDGIDEFAGSTLQFTVAVDEVVEIDTDVVIRRTVEVPINTAIPINETFDTTIEIDTPLGALPLDVTVPVDIEVPVDLVVDIPINETVPINDEFPVQLDVPIAIDVRETELAELTDSLAAGLESLREVLNGLGG